MRHFYLFRGIIAVNFALVLSYCSLLNGQEFRTFIGENNSIWESPTNWDPNLVPDSITEGARVQGGRVHVGSTTVIDTLEIIGSGGVVMNQQNELRTNKLLIAGGGLFGTGTVQIMESGSMSGSIGHTWDQLTVINNGTFEVKDLTLANSPLVENRHTMIFSDDDSIGDTNMIGVPEPLPTTVINTGFLRKETGTGLAVFTARFESTGEIFSQAGTLDVRGGGINTGAIRTQDDGIVRLSGREIKFGDGSSIFGTGTTKLSSGHISADAGVVVPVNNFTMEASLSRMGGEGSFELSGDAIEFSDGQLLDSVTVRVLDGASLEVSGSVWLQDSSLLINEAGAMITMSASDSSFTNNGITILRNLGTIELTNDGNLTNNGPFNEFSFMTVENEGAIRKTGGTGTSIFSHVLEGEGEIFSSSGTIQINSTGFIRGTLKTEGDGIIRINSSDLTFEDGSSITGTGTTKVSSGFIKVAEGVTVAVNNFLTDQSGSRLGGDGEFQLSGDALEFRGGQFKENVTVRVLSGASLMVTSGFSMYDNPTLINDSGGTITLSANTSSLTNSGLTILTNNGTVEFTADGDITNNGPLSEFSFTNIENNGIIRKTGGTGDSFLAFGEYSGSGLLRVETGTIRLSGIKGANELTGTVEILSGATLRGASTVDFAPGTMVKGEGTIRSTFVNFGGTTAPGMSIGTLAVTGKSLFEESNTFAVELGAGGSADKLDVSGDATIDGELVITLDGGYMPVDGDSWVILTANSVSGKFDTITAPAAAAGFGYFVDYNGQNVTVVYEWKGFRRAVEQATGDSIPADADLNDYIDEDSDGDGLADLVEWRFETDIANPTTGHGLQIVELDNNTPQTIVMRMPFNSFATDTNAVIEAAESPEGPYTELPVTTLWDMDEVIDGVLYRSFEAELAAGPIQARFIRVKVTLQTN